MSTDNNKQLSRVSSKQLAEYFSVSTRTVSNWKKSGIIPFLRVGRVVRFDIAEVEAALEEYKIRVYTRDGKVVAS